MFCRVKIKRRTSRFFILVLIKILYDYLTVNILDNLWYTGFGSYGINFNWNKEFISFSVFIIFTVFLVRRFAENSFVNLFIYALYAVYYIPINSAYAINNTDISFFICSNVFVFLIMFFCSTRIVIGRISLGASSKSKKNIEDYSTLLDDKRIRIACFTICILCLIYKIMYNGFSFSLSIFSDTLYDARASYVASMDAISGSLIAYVLTLIKNLSGCVAPFYLYYGLKKRNIIAVSGSIICLLSLFSIAAGKGTIIFVAVVLAILWCEKYSSFSKIIDWMLFAIGIALLFCLIHFQVTGSYSFYFLIFRRQMYYPAWLNTLYFDYFSRNPKVYFSQSTFLLQNIIPSFYNQQPIMLISAEYYRSLIPSPNTGMFADAYMNLGIVGIFVFPVVITFLLNKSAKVFASYGEGISILMAVKFVLHLTNVPMFRTDSVLSIWLFTFLLFLIPKVYIVRKRGNMSGI